MTVYKSYPLPLVIIIVFPKKMSSKKSVKKINFGQKSKQVSKSVGKTDGSFYRRILYTNNCRKESEIMLSAMQIRS
ncbi:MAG: hypothetical protein A4E58_01816 [Syntrophorhabdus sp. PtaB.Bin006]|nr:MAG: hypothetical protein A4E58_01816 [Syntrophorhabdus sp. PtaB.Bin006]